MSYATSRPLFNKFVGGVDIAATVRTHLLANTGNQKIARLRNVANAVSAASKIHPVRLMRVMRRMSLITLDLAN